MSTRHPALAIIGAGRVGRALGRQLRQRGWRVGAVVTRSRKTARAAVRAIGAGRPLAHLDASALAADVVLITTPDRSIATVAEQLARAVVRFQDPGGVHRTPETGARVFPPLSGGGPAGLKLTERPRRGGTKLTVLHTNGALDRSVLAPLERLGAATGSLHPLQTFSGRAVPQLDGCICAIEGMPAALCVARRICRDLGCIPVVIAPQSKPAYHAAGTLAAGHILAIIEAATRILIAQGFSRRDAVRALLPLTRQTLANFESAWADANAAWTGPLARGDFATVRKHAAALRRFPREYREAYAALSRLSLLVLRKGSGQ